MNFTKIEIIGFKSFANKVTVPLMQGFTAISGPNGSGKSNIIDSVLFALGLTTARTLRSEQGVADLITNHNKRGEASVKVTFTDEKTENEFSLNLSDNLTIEYGKVTKKFSNSFNLQVNDGSANNYSWGNANVYVVDNSKNSNKITFGDSSDIQKYDESKPERVFVRIYKDEVADIVIIKN